MDTRSDDRILIVVPFHHAYGLGLLLLGLFANCTLIIMPTFEPQLFLTLVQEYRITYLPVVPPIVMFLAKHPLVDRYDFCSVRELLSAAAPLSKNLLQQEKQPSAGLTISAGSEFSMLQLL
ncbi:PREDICTED: 4-coumarate--CoA ligase 1-like, partial [Wasmannia auropunctata]|uniref:4-coumarate--CoA ligase 1-like n=1 Tax=Wasmannia auropunctata TaxID=64793 RepID=UPI0005EF3A08